MAKAPGKSYRQGLALLEIADKFGNEEDARKWIESKRWKNGPHCPHCGSYNVQSDINHKTMTHRCRDCPKRPMFTVKVGTVMEGSKLKFRVWAIGLYLYTTNIKGISSMRLHRELGIGQKAAWHLLHRIRKAAEKNTPIFGGEVEVDETFIGGKRKNMPNSKRKEMTGRGAVGKAVVAGMKNRDTNKITAQVVQKTDAKTLQGFVEDNTEEETMVYTDDAKAYVGLDRPHETVCHSVGEYVKAQAHTNGIESFWALMKRGYTGTYHKMSPKHLSRYVNEFGERYNNRPLDTIEQMEEIVKAMPGKRLTYQNLIADNGLDSGARRV